ncbi:haloacid dehalogenase-like hydrolase [bacterium]|nr:haloacid dehalogenase-like hydrolase [bacterium]
MLIGVDFDNTIVCYDQVFHQVAVEQGLIPLEVPVSKGEVRDYLRQCGREDDWTELQGYVYGARMQDATPFPCVLECLARFVKHGIMVCIISHKTRYPYMGPKYDLHQAAQRWLEQQGFFDKAQVGLSPNQVSFELTKQEKLERIAKVGCTHFIDDLPEFLAEPGFPAGVKRILFDPNENHPTDHHCHRVTSWMEIEKIILRDVPLCGIPRIGT